MLASSVVLRCRERPPGKKRSPPAPSSTPHEKQGTQYKLLADMGSWVKLSLLICCATLVLSLSLSELLSPVCKGWTVND